MEAGKPPGLKKFKRDQDTHDLLRLLATQIMRSFRFAITAVLEIPEHRVPPPGCADHAQFSLKR
jgi:hypothetical protein